MNSQVDFNFFAEEEDQFFSKVRQWRDKAFKPVIDFLKQHRVSADALSYLGLFMTVPFVFFLGFNPGLAFFFLILSLLCDVLDGPLARANGKVTLNGAILDHFICDYFAFFIVFLSFLYYGMINPFWSAVYLLNYVIMLLFIIVFKALKLKFFTVIKSKYGFYLVFLIWLVSGYNLFDPFLVLFSIYMLVTNFFLYSRLRWFLAQ